MLQTGYIEDLQIQPQKGLTFESVQTVELEAGKGIIGDCHYGKSEKQIALLSLEAKQWIKNYKVQGICIARFQENILIRGINFMNLKSGDILMSNEIKIEVIANSNRCYSECDRIENNLQCNFQRYKIFAKVTQSGLLRVGDPIWIK